jgi:hypothetical protein
VKRLARSNRLPIAVAALALALAALGCSSTRDVEPKTAHDTATCTLPRNDPPASVGELAGERGEGAIEWSLGEGTLKPSDWSDATLDLIDLAPGPDIRLTPEAVLRARLRYSIDRHPNARYALFAQFRMPGDASTFEGTISNDSYPSVDRTADVVDITFPLSHAMKDDRLMRPIQVKFVLTQFFSNEESVVIAETEYFELGPA